MSYLKAIWWRPAVSLLVVLAIAALWMMGSGTTHAGNAGTVSIDPATAQVGAGGTTTVNVNVTAPDTGLSVWIVEVKYDPAVVQVDLNGGNPVCTAPEVTGSTVHAEGCATKDASPVDGTKETAVAYGAWVKNDNSTATGWSGTNTVATFTFKAVGTAGQSSALEVNVCAQCFIGPAAQENHPTEVNGQITITAGTSRVWGDFDCNGSVATRDNQSVLKIVLIQNPISQTEPCPDIGTQVSIDGTSRIWGDADCNGSVATRDNQAILKIVLIQNPISQTEPCPDVGTTVTQG
jgi:hypothetical protein